MTDFFPKIHTATMGNEGGVNFNPNDLGNIVVNGIVTVSTYKGIAPKVWPKWSGWKFISGVIAMSTTMPHYGTKAYLAWAAYLNSQLAQLNQLQAAVVEFYRTNFWNANRLGEITSEAVAAWMYDHVVNAGKRGIIWAQLAAKTTPDGKLGPVSITAINSADPDILLERMEDIAGAFRLDRAHDNPTQIQFLTSWLRRDGQPDSIIAMVRKAAADGRLDDSEVASIKAAMTVA